MSSLNPVALLLLPLLTGCAASDELPDPRVIEFGGLSLITGLDPDVMAQTYTFFAGTVALEFSLDAELNGMTEDCPLTVRSSQRS